MKKILLTLTALGILATSSFAETEISGGRYTDFGFRSDSLIDCKDFTVSPDNTIEKITLQKNGENVSYVIFTNEDTEQSMIFDKNDNKECHKDSGIMRTFVLPCSYEDNFKSSGSKVINEKDIDPKSKIFRKTIYKDHNFIKYEYKNGDTFCYADFTKKDAEDYGIKNVVGFVGTTTFIGGILGGPVGAVAVLGFYGINYFVRIF